MAGVVTQNANQVRQKAYAAVYGTSKTGKLVSPYHFYSIKALFLHLAMNKGNPDLQYIPYGTADITTNGGYQPLGAGACTLYAWYGLAQRTTSVTASFQAIHDASDNSATTTTIATQLINLKNQSFMFVWPDGMPIATEVTISAATAVGGATESTASDATAGFLIVSA